MRWEAPSGRAGTAADFREPPAGAWRAWLSEAVSLYLQVEEVFRASPFLVEDDCVSIMNGTDEGIVTAHISGAAAVHHTGFLVPAGDTVLVIGGRETGKDNAAVPAQLPFTLLASRACVWAAPAPGLVPKLPLEALLCGRKEPKQAAGADTSETALRQKVECHGH